MTDKGAAGANVFKLIVKVDLKTKSTVSKKGLKVLQKIFERDIDHLRQHFQSYRELHSQHVHCVIQEKKRLGFEFWLKNAKELEQLWAATKNDSLANALSEYSDRKGLNIDIGLDSEHLCFECKIETKHYTEGLEYFQEESSESSDEESEEEDDSNEEGTKVKQSVTHSDASNSNGTSTSVEHTTQGGGVAQQKSPSPETSKVKQIVTLFEASNSTGTGTPVKHSTNAGDQEAAEMRVDQQKLSGNEGTLDVSSSERGPQIETTQTLSGHGREVNTSSAAPPQTGSSVDVVSFVQMDQPGSADKSVSKESGWSFRKLLFWVDKSETKANQMPNTNHGSTVQSVQQTVTATNIERNGHLFHRIIYKKILA